MQRVHQMILADVGEGGLEAARSKLKKTPFTTVVRGDGVRLRISRGDDGIERQEMVEKRDEDLSYLGCGAASETSAEKGSVGQGSSPSVSVGSPPQPQIRCEEDLLDTSESQRFDVEDPAFLEHLEEHGYVVVKEVASPSDRAVAEDLLWQFLFESAGFERADPSTWNDGNFERIGCIATGIIDGAGIGQSDFVWHLRLLPLVRQAFAKIWDSEDLLTSFDAACIFRPWQHKEHGFTRTHGGWYHIDQGRGLPGLQAVQGLVSLLDVDAASGGLVVAPGSHNHFDDIVKFQYDNKNYVSVPACDPILELPKKLVTCKAGDLVLWDSRCVHCSALGRYAGAPQTTTAQSARVDAQLLRIVAYICMTTKSRASPEVLQQRCEAYRNRTTTSHWPHLFIATRAGKGVKSGSGPLLDIDDERKADRRSLIA